MKRFCSLFLGLALLFTVCIPAAGAEFLDLPEDLLTVEEEAFLNCTSLTGELSLPAGVVTIGAYAFAGCTGFSGLPVIPPSVQTIGAHAFDGCTGLSGTLYIGENVNIDETAFANCPGLKVVRGTKPELHVAMLADGFIQDDAFLNDCYDAADAFCDEHDHLFNVFQTGENVTADDAVDQAVSAGCNVIILPGFQYSDGLPGWASRYEEVKFIGIDFTLDETPSNVFTATYREEQAGFMAGYAAVKLGYRHLGFLGGMDIPSVNSYGYGFVQGAATAASELGNTGEIQVEYDYAGTFAPNPDITAHMRKWYDAMGVEVVFACGGGIWGAVGGAIAEGGKGKLIGVDTDQASVIDGIFGDGTTVTSAMKNTGVTVKTVLEAIEENNWADFGGDTLSFGVVSSDPERNHVGLAPSTRFAAGFTVEDYETLVGRLYDGTYAPDSTSISGVGIPVRGTDPLCVALITDYGDITDQSFNQTSYEACTAFAEANSLSFRYYKPASDSDEDRITSIEKAIDDGHSVIIMPGYAFGPAIQEVAPEYDDITFIALDVSEGDIGDLASAVPANLYCAVYQEELCGYMAGYAAVKLGYTKLGFLGGMAVPAVVRYGYGFVQGADAAAAELGLSDVEVKYVYGNQFYGDSDITAYMDTWYAAGTEVVFACGGGIFTSAAEAAARAGGKVIGVDVDQAGTIDGLYGEGITLTSAMKGLSATIRSQLQAILDGTFEGGRVETLGIVSDVPAENHVQLAPSTRFSSSFTEADYEALVSAMHSGSVSVSGNTNTAPATTAFVVDYQGNIK